MNIPRFSEDVRSVTDLKTHPADLVQQVRKSRRPMLLTRRGKGVAVLLNLEDYEELVDRIAFIDAVRQGAKDAAAGRLHPNSEALKILDTFGK